MTPPLPFAYEEVLDGSLLVKGDVLDEGLRTKAREMGWVKEDGGPRWLHPTGGILPLL